MGLLNSCLSFNRGDDKHRERPRLLCGEVGKSERRRKKVEQRQRFYHSPLLLTETILLFIPAHISLLLLLTSYLTVVFSSSARNLSNVQTFSQSGELSAHPPLQ